MKFFHFGSFLFCQLPSRLNHGTLYMKMTFKVLFVGIVCVLASQSQALEVKSQNGIKLIDLQLDTGSRNASKKLFWLFCLFRMLNQIIFTWFQKSILPYNLQAVAKENFIWFVMITRQIQLYLSWLLPNHQFQTTEESLQE